MLKKNILSSTIAITMMATSLLTPAITHAQTYNVQRAEDHKQRAEESMQQTMLIHDRERSKDLVTLWMAPEGECSSNGDGSKDNPVCTFSQLSNRLDSLYKQGKARGDVDIRFKTGENIVYTPPVGGRFGDFLFSPTAGHVVRFIPDWYNNVKDLENITIDKMVKFKGNPVGVAQNADSEKGIFIRPRVNRGGTYQISGFHFDTFINPIWFLNDQMPTDPVVDGDDPTSVYRNIRYSKNAAFNNILVSHNYFDRIGGKYTDAAVPNPVASSLRMWGVTNSIIKDNTFINGNIAKTDRTWTPHAIYNYMSSDNVYDNNTFKDNIYSGPKVRMTNDEIFMNNIFDHPKSPQPLLLTGYQEFPYGEGGDRDNKQYAECKGEGPYYENLGNEFKQEGKIHITNDKEQLYCTNKNRITAPMFVEGIQTGDFEYSLRWGESDTNGDGVKSYHVYIGGLDSKGYPVEEPILLKTVDATTRELTMTKDMLEKAGMKPNQDFYYYVVAEGNSGWRSARTQHRMTINLDEKYKGREHYNVARSESFDRIIGGKKPEKSTFSYDLVAEKLNPSYGEKNVSAGEKISQKISLDNIPIYTTFTVDEPDFPGKVSINNKTGELTVDTQGIEEGEYTINVTAQYGDWSKDVVPFVLKIKNSTTPTADYPENTDVKDSSTINDNDIEPEITTTKDEKDYDSHISETNDIDDTEDSDRSPQTQEKLRQESSTEIQDNHITKPESSRFMGEDSNSVEKSQDAKIIHNNKDVSQGSHIYQNLHEREVNKVSPHYIMPNRNGENIYGNYDTSPSHGPIVHTGGKVDGASVLVRILNIFTR